jgi:hypothetical protein
MVGDTRDFNNIETRAVIKFVFLQDKAPKEIHAILTETLWQHAPSYGWTDKILNFFECLAEVRATD